jgi:hypothetical protein
MDPKISFIWQKDSAGYELTPGLERLPESEEVDDLLGPSAVKRARVVPRGGQLITYEPPLGMDEEEGGQPLYLRFANLLTAEDVLRFIEAYGLLAGKRSDEIWHVLWQAAAFRSYLRRDEKRLASWVGMKKEGMRLARLDLVLARDRTTGDLRLQYQPPTLLAALWLQLGRRLTHERALRDCRHCGELFETGPGTGKRMDASFCSEAHRMLYHSRKRSKGSAANA